MKQIVALPVLKDKLSRHFGNCEKFVIASIEDQHIEKIEYVDPPAHKPGAYPKFMAENGVNVVLTYGMGDKATAILSRNRIKIIKGVDVDTPERILDKYIKGKLVNKNVPCEH